jgi:PadR family transcriptional regulator PadR
MEADRVKTACSETLVISLLKDRPMHGYEMCKVIEQRSGGYFTLKHGTLYPLLHRLEKRGVVTSEWGAMDSGKPRRYYRLTRAGMQAHVANIESWRELFSSLTALVPEVAA